MDKVGKEGVITVEDGKSLNNELDVVEGMQFDRGYLSPYFINNPDKQSRAADNPVRADLRQEDQQHPRPAADAGAGGQVRRPLLIIAEESKARPWPRWWSTPSAASSRSAPSRPGFGDRRKAMLEDIAILTGGKVIAEEVGLTLEKVTLADLARPSASKSRRKTPRSSTAHGTAADIEARVKQVRVQIEEATSDYDREKLQERVAKLAGGVAVSSRSAPRPKSR